MIVDIALPPGIYKNGTRKQSEGRYYEGNLVRFQEGAIKPVKGWRALSQSAVSGKGREIVTWRDNNNQIWAGIGTHTNLYSMTQSGVITDITPSGFTTGAADASNGGGYGSGVYGAGVYGLPITSVSAIIEASVWSLDNWGQDLVGVMGAGGTLYTWTPGDAQATALANAPTCVATLVIDARIQLALGADGNPRRVAWSDFEDNTNWTPGSGANQAGGQSLQTQGKLMTGVKVPGGAVLFTETDLHRAEYVGLPEVLLFERVSDGSGAISQNSAVEIDGQVIWMGPQGFWQYNGFASPLACDVADDVFTNINRAQISKVTAFHNSAYGEIWWFYPDNNSVENNRYVSYSYREGHWSEGGLTRLAAADMSPFPSPLMIGDDGIVYEHEVGENRGGSQAYLKGGPLEFGQGDNFLDIKGYIPDTNTLGDATFTICSRYYPLGPETEYGPYTASERTDFRASGREFEVRYDGADNTSWRIGDGKLEIEVRGTR